MFAEIGENFLKFIDAFLALNNSFCSTLLKLLVETCRATGIVLSALSEASKQIGFYVLACGMEVINILGIFIGMIYTLGIVVAQICTILLNGLNVIAGCIAACTKTVLKYLVVNIVSLVHYMNPLLQSLKGMCQETVEYMFEISKSCAEITSSYISHWTVASFKNLASFLLLIKEHTICGYSSIKLNSIALFEQIKNTLGLVFMYMDKNIPKDVAVWTLGAICLSYTFIYVKKHLSQRGLTFPSFSLSSNEITINLDNERDYDAFDSSEEEVDESDEESITSEDSYNTYLDDSDVEEYEVVSDSEESSVSDEENTENDIVIQLPDPNERYSLRSRATPFGDRTNNDTSLSPIDLEKILEKERDRRACVVCQDAPKCVLVLPCRHMCLCVDCAHHIASTRLRHRRICPLCRTKMETVMNVYL